MLTKWMLVASVLAAAGVIAAVVYRQYAIRFTRVDATRELLELAERLDRCFARTGSYALLDSEPNACVVLPLITTDGSYRVAGEIAASTFLLTATPQLWQARDAECGAFTLNHAGNRGVTGTGTPASCWADPQR